MPANPLTPDTQLLGISQLKFDLIDLDHMMINIWLKMI